MAKARKPIRTEKRHMGFIVFADATQNAAIQQLANMMPMLQGLIEQATAAKVRAVK